MLDREGIRENINERGVRIKKGGWVEQSYYDRSGIEEKYEETERKHDERTKMRTDTRTTSALRPFVSSKILESIVSAWSSRRQNDIAEIVQALMYGIMITKSRLELSTKLFSCSSDKMFGVLDVCII